MTSSSYWEDKHRREIEANSPLSENVSQDAVETEKQLGKRSTVLDLGCGTGYDAAYFARSGHVVTATDISASAIQHCVKTHSEKDEITFLTHNTSDPLPFENETFDLVYARLSLHYFDDETTRAVFEEIHRTLSNDGRLFFACKSTNDPLYGKGEVLDEDTYSINGHIRHFFSTKYCQSLCQDLFSIDSIEEIKGNLYGSPSVYVRVSGSRI